VIVLHYESRFGLARGAVWADGRPHIYMEGLEADPSLALLGTRSLARLKGRAGGVAFLDLADGAEAILDAPPQDLAKLTDGAAVEIDIAAEARRDKLARARLIRLAPGETPQRLSPVQTLNDRLLAEARACFGDAPVAIAGEDAALDEAADEALAPRPAMAGGGAVHIERTRALIACDVDGGGLSEARARTNERAVAEVARRLRLMALGGLVVVDLIGRRHDDRRLHDGLRAAFGAEAASIIMAPAGKFGTLEFVRPWRVRPPADTPEPLHQAGRLMRDAVREAQFRPGRLLTLRGPAPVLDIMRPHIQSSRDPLSPLLRLETGPTCEVIAS
jgi:hypothetical protein